MRKPVGKWDARFFRLDNKPFYGCVNLKLEWFDSALSFDTAIHWCCYSFGEMNLTPTEELKYFSTNDTGISIIHSSILEGLVKNGIIV